MRSRGTGTSQAGPMQSPFLEQSGVELPSTSLVNDDDFDVKKNRAPSWTGAYDRWQRSRSGRAYNRLLGDTRNHQASDALRPQPMMHEDDVVLEVEYVGSPKKSIDLSPTQRHTGSGTAMKGLPAAQKQQRRFTIKGDKVDAKLEPPLIRSGLEPLKEPEGVSVIEFDSVEYLAYETDACVKLQVVRKGSVDRPVRVEWHNENRNTADGFYLQQSGTVTMEAGEKSAMAFLRLLPDRRWSTEAVQTVSLRLVGAEAMVDGDAVSVLGDVWQALVVVLNSDPFPYGLTDREASDKKIKMVNYFVLHMWSQMGRKAWLGVLFRLYPGISFIINQVTLLTFVNYAFGEDSGYSTKNRLIWLGVLCFLFICNFAATHYSTMAFTKLRLGGSAAQYLRSCIIDTALQFTRAEQTRLPAAVVNNVAEQDVQTAVTSVWENTFEFLGALFQLICNLAFAWAVNISGIEAGSFFTILICTIPVGIGVIDTAVLMFSYEKMAQLAYATSASSDRKGGYGTEVLALRQTITTFNMGFIATKHYDALHTTYSDTAQEGTLYRTRWQWAARSCANVLTAALLASVGYLVIEKGYPVGNFVTLFNTMASYSATLSSLFDLTFQILEGYGPILKIRNVLNAETRRTQLLQWSKSREVELHFGGSDAANSEASCRPVEDNELRLQDVFFRFDDNAHHEPLSMIPVGIQAGQVLSIRAFPGFGKRTLLALIAQFMAPDRGFIQYPSSWRVRYISSSPQLFDDTLLANFRFGEFFEHTDEEIWSLCRHFGFNPSLIGRGDFLVGDNGNRLSSTDAIMVCLLRAMLSSPDLILLPCTLDPLGEEVAARVITCLREYVRDRRFRCLDGSEVSKRSAAPVERLLLKDKTVIICTKLRFIEEQMDNAITITNVHEPGETIDDR